MTPDGTSLQDALSSDIQTVLTTLQAMEEEKARLSLFLSMLAACASNTALDLLDEKDIAHSVAELEVERRTALQSALAEALRALTGVMPLAEIGAASEVRRFEAMDRPFDKSIAGMIGKDRTVEVMAQAREHHSRLSNGLGLQEGAQDHG